jgi:Mg2+-importing ATPase
VSPSNAPFWSDAPDVWFSKTGSNPEGLSRGEAQRRHRASQKHKKSKPAILETLSLLVNQFTHPLMVMLIVAVIISAFLREITDASIVFAIILSAGLVGFYQEKRALRVVRTLNQLLSPTTTVMREGKSQVIPSAEVVSGDVIEFNAGDMIPADCLLIEAKELHVNEASLTGESSPARKFPGIVDASSALIQRTNCLWKGTHIVSGTAKALAIFEGGQSIFGKIMESVSQHIPSSFEIGLKQFGFLLMRITLVLTVLVWAVILMDDRPLMTASLFALALGVGMAPELLPAITTIAMSNGARKLLARHVIVKTLPSIQNLGEVNLLCTDKTGTITTGDIQVKEIVDSDGLPSRTCERFAFINAKLQTGYTNPIDESILRLENIDISQVQKLDEIPYDFHRKRLTVVIREREQQLAITKGAWKTIAPLCIGSLQQDGSTKPMMSEISKIQSLFDTYSESGLRVLALAFRQLDDESQKKVLEENFTFAGFILLEDALRENVDETIKSLTKLGVALKVITGDNRKIAEATGLKMGLSQPLIMTGQEMMAEPPEVVAKKMSQIQIFAEVEPQQKEWIIQQLRNSYKVAYLGDGINDVPALHAADIGISVNNAADVARDAADVVLTEKNLDAVVLGIREGRKTFANTLKYINISTGSTMGNMISVAIASVILPFLPMLPKQILMTNFLSDIPYIFIASDEVDTEDISRPGLWDMKKVKRNMMVFGLHSTVFDIVTFCILKFMWFANETTFQTAWFVESVLSELMILWVLRTRQPFYRSRPANGLMLTTLCCLALTIALPFLPWGSTIGVYNIPLSLLATMLGIVILYVISAEWLKRILGNSEQRKRS